MKIDKNECEKTIFNCLQIVYNLRTLLNPFIPNATDKLSDILGIDKLQSHSTWDMSELKDVYQHQLLDLNWIKLTQEVMPLFQKVEDIVLD